MTIQALTHKRWLVAATAAIAVLAVVAAVAVVLARRNSPARPQRAPGAAPIQTTVPPYYVALDSLRPASSYPEPVAVATLRETATGAVLARITPPRPYNSFAAVSGAADDRTFVLLAKAPTDPFTDATPERFFLLRVDPTASAAAGRTKLTALPASDIPGGKSALDVPLGDQVGTMALSPDGTRLAAILTLARTTRSHTQPLAFASYLYVYDLANGTTQIWVRKLCGTCQQTDLGNEWGNASERPDMANLSWASNGKSLAFIAGAGVTQLRLLDLSGRGDNVQPDSTPFVIHAPVGTWTQAVMAPDGKTVFLSYNFSGYISRGHIPVWASMMRFSAVTGQLSKINTLPLIEASGHAGGYSASGPLTADTILWTSYDGSKVIVADAAPGNTVGVYSGSTYTPIPWPADAIGAAW